MPRKLEYRDLESHERRACMLRAAGGSIQMIALELECSAETVRQLLKRPRVARFLMLLQGFVADGVEDLVEAVNVKIRATADRAFEVESTMMEDFVDMGEQHDDDPHVKIRAKLGAVATAQDILDRAGNRAPTKTINTNLVGNLPAEALAGLADILKESRAIDVSKESPGREEELRQEGPTSSEEQAMLQAETNGRGGEEGWTQETPINGEQHEKQQEINEKPADADAEPFVSICPDF